MQMVRGGFSLIELLVVITIISVLAAIATPYYKAYYYRTKIQSMIEYTGYLQDWVEQQHANGVVFGTNFFGPTGTCQIDTCTSPPFPPGIRDLNINNYGCIGVEPNLVTLGLETTLANRMPIFLCPSDNATNTSGAVTWTCGYLNGLGASATELSYLPANCQQILVQDVNF